MALTRLGTNAITSVPSSAITALPAGLGGKVLQVVSATKTSDQSTNSTSYVDVTGLTLTITPSSTSNKILIVVCVNNIGNTAGSGSNVKLLRDSTVVTKNTSGAQSDTFEAFGNGGGGGMGAGSDDRKISHAIISHLDTPSSISSLVYKVQMRSSNSANTSTLNRWALNTDIASVSTITAYEIAG